MKHKIHIISFDGLSKVDMDFLKTQENFKRLLDGASYSFEVDSIYPTLTYPAHTSIVTGNYPCRHGIVNNTLTQPFRKRPDWYWYEKDIKTKTFQQLAMENKYTILSLFWPVTAGSKIKYNMPEIFANRPWDNQLFVSLRNGSKAFQIDLLGRYGKILKSISQPALDNFTHKNYLYSLDNYKADIHMVHYIDLDSTRHDFGFNSKEAKEALLRHEKRLGEILDRIEATSDMENTSIFVLGDHSSMDADYIIFLNTIFEKHGLLKSKYRQVLEYEIFAKEAGGSTYVYSYGNHSFDEIREIIEEEIPEGAIEAIYTGEEAGKLGADPSCFMMLEASKNYLFEEGMGDHPVMHVDDLVGADLYFHTNNHGYSPYLKSDYETVFIAKGKGIKAGVNIGRMSLVDEGPTFAKLLGLDLGDTDGRILEEILIGE